MSATDLILAGGFKHGDDSYLTRGGPRRSAAILDLPLCTAAQSCPTVRSSRIPARGMARFTLICAKLSGLKKSILGARETDGPVPEAPDARVQVHLV